jgi:hypothetical protein
MKKLISACGINCAECEARIATIENDNAKRKEVAAKWSKAYDASINCTGCMEDGIKFSHCNECEYRECVVEMGIEHCSECDDYPCEELEQFFEHVPQAKENLEALKG